METGRSSFFVCKESGSCDSIGSIGVSLVMNVRKCITEMSILIEKPCAVSIQIPS